MNNNFLVEYFGEAPLSEWQKYFAIVDPDNIYESHSR
jgi:hypothetical protein